MWESQQEQFLQQIHGGGGGGNGKKTYQTNVTYEPYLDPDSNSTTVKRHLSNDI